MQICSRLSVLATAAIAAMSTVPAHADIAVGGSYYMYPIAQAIGPGDTDLGLGTTLVIGSGTAGSFAATAGSSFSTGFLLLADLGTGTASALVDGAKTVVHLGGNGDFNSLEIGWFGQADMTVSGGATLDGRTNPAGCLQGNAWCNAFVSTTAGSTGTFTITGAGSNASFLGYFAVGNASVWRFGDEQQGFVQSGVRGGTSHGIVNILNGGLLTTDGGVVGRAPDGNIYTGAERSIGDVTIDGAGSTWRLTGGTKDSSGAYLSTAEYRNAWATINISHGGTLLVDGRDGQYNSVSLTANGGRTDMTLTDVGSSITFAGDAGSLSVGQSGGTANLSVLNGAEVRHVWYLGVGRGGSFGQMVLDGAGSRVIADATASATAAGSSLNAVVEIGSNGTGVVSLSNGARIDISAKEARNNGPLLGLGVGAASSGTLNIDGAGSVVALSATSVLAGGGPGEAFNPLVRVGQDGSGRLNITGGGKLLLDGQAVSTPADSRSTSLFIGGTSSTQAGGNGIALVSGAGSEIAVTGNDAYIGVAHGPQSSGQLTIQDQASVSATNMNVGRSGGVGVLRMDAGILNLSGQQTGNTLSGASLSIGNGGGTGIATIDHGSQITLTNMGSAGVSLNVGGSGANPLGDGTLTLTGASQIKLLASGKNASVNVGRDGSALMRIRGASVLDVGQGSLYVGRLSGSDGTLLVSEGSSVIAGWVGVGRNRMNGVDTDGGTATMVLNNSTLTAAQIVIGTNGFLGGNGTIIGNVVNHGIFSPGNSPGTMTIDGAYTAASGNRLIMEVQADGLGGYKTDQVIFGDGSALDLGALNVEFRFLGGTDPSAFQASGGFDVDTFFHLQKSDGSLVDVSHTLFSTASFSASADQYAISNFTFSADGGATFSAQAVPEPGSWLLLAGGLLALYARRQSARRGS